MILRSCLLLPSAHWPCYHGGAADRHKGYMLIHRATTAMFPLLSAAIVHDSNTGKVSSQC